MQAHELVELAAMVAVHGPAMIQAQGQTPDGAIETYWAASKCRLNRWAKTLKRQAEGGPAPPPSQARPGLAVLRCVLEEILASEVLTRVWTAVMSAYDQHFGTDQMAPVAHSVFVGQLEARHRMLTLLVHGQGIDPAESLRLNHLRSQTERWTDLLVGSLAGISATGAFAVDPQRAADFSEDLVQRSGRPPDKLVWPLLLEGLRATFRQGLCSVCPNADLNSEIVSSILAFFQPELIDCAGLFQSLWLLRMTSTARQAQGLIDRLLAETD
jgi:hypothetical protein